jgi:hypothetical protein
MAKNGPAAYWLRGEEECLHCQQSYTFAVERRCTHCDAPSCPHCVTVVHATGETICTPCAQAGVPEGEPQPSAAGAAGRPQAPVAEARPRTRARKQES